MLLIKIYFFYFLFGSYKKLFPRILIEKIKDFPIKVPENNNEKDLASKIIKKVEILLDLNESEVEKSNIIQKEIDNLVFELYEIPDVYRKPILESINNI